MYKLALVYYSRSSASFIQTVVDNNMNINILVPEHLIEFYVICLSILHVL